ncbi:MAG TPA: TonB-dependent receptor [Sphingomonas sp.]|nr:TonB-dependent receptor [Sphingomonas sp.]
MRGITMSAALVRSASVIAIATGLAASTAAFAQTAPDPQQDTAPTDVGAASGNAAVGQDIVVTGIRASLERSIAIKRDSTGVVDAISAEDIGKFPDTNLAESLQRITGVSIDRVNGEGSQVTVRGFGAQYNLVTLNGRQLAATSIQAVGGDQGGDGAGGFSRSFDFGNLASEGVQTLEVYKTGRAAVPSGGIGATINIVSRHPLDAHQSGLTGSIGVKGDFDTSSMDCIDCGARVTPELSGLVSWKDQDDRFGVALFGSYQKRNFSVPSQANDDWNIRTLSDFLNPSQGFVTANTKINNMPSDPNTLVSVPNDSRYHFSEDSRERINGQAMLQFRPVDSLTLSVDGLFAQDRASERRSDESNWFNRPFDEVTFDDNPGVATTKYLHEVINGVKDTGSEQAYRAQKNRLWDVGANLKWDVSDRFTLALDGHIGKSESLPDNPNGQTSTTVAFSSPILTAHSLDWGTNGFPVQTVEIDDSIKGNGNGVWDLGDLAGQVQRQFRSTQTQRIKEARLDAGWQATDTLRFDVGGDYRTTKTRQTQYNTSQTLGDWGNSLPPEIAAVAPGLVREFCLVCRFHHNDPKASGNDLIAWRTEDPTALYNALYNYYINMPADANGVSPDGINHQIRVDTNNDNRVQEDIWGAYAQASWNGTIAGMKSGLVAGVRFESTDVKALSYQLVPQAIVWTADNDFFIKNSADQQAVTGKGHYTNFLPSIDFQISPFRNVIARLSYSKTIARPQFGNLFAATSAGTPPRATATGGVATGNQNNPDLDPLDSDNFDLSLEYYPKPDSFFSVGVFDKRVHNFIGNTLVNKNLFGLTDPTSGAAGTRSGGGKQILQNVGADITDVNLFTASALVQQHGGDIAAAQAEFLQHYDTTTHSVNQTFADDIFATVDIAGDSSDPLMNFSVNTPINNKNAEIWGIEVAGQWFFGNTGIGIAGSYTLVRGDVGIDVNADPSVNQFALVGLSDTANATLIYDKNGISARLAYNWRGKFLSQLNRDSYHNPVFTAPYSQLDLNVSFDLNDHLSLTFEGINLLEEGVRTYGRDKINTWFETEGSARYLLGARYRF